MLWFFSQIARVVSAIRQNLPHFVSLRPYLECRRNCTKCVFSAVSGANEICVITGVCVGVAWGRVRCGVRHRDCLYYRTWIILPSIRLAVLAAGTVCLPIGGGLGDRCLLEPTTWTCLELCNCLRLMRFICEMQMSRGGSSWSSCLHFWLLAELRMHLPAA